MSNEIFKAEKLQPIKVDKLNELIFEISSFVEMKKALYLGRKNNIEIGLENLLIEFSSFDCALLELFEKLEQFYLLIEATKRPN